MSSEILLTRKEAEVLLVIISRYFQGLGPMGKDGPGDFLKNLQSKLERIRA